MILSYPQFRVAGRSASRLMFARAGSFGPSDAHGAAQNRRAALRPATCTWSCLSPPAGRPRHSCTSAGRNHRTQVARDVTWSRRQARPRHVELVHLGPCVHSGQRVGLEHLGVRCRALRSPGRARPSDGAPPRAFRRGGRSEASRAEVRAANRTRPRRAQGRRRKLGIAQAMILLTFPDLAGYY